MSEHETYSVDRLLHLVFGCVVVAALVWLAQYLSDALVPFVLGLVAAYLMNPLVERLERVLPHRVGAVILSLALVGTTFAAAVLVVAPLVAAEVSHMGRLVQEMVQNSALAAEAAKRLPPDLWQALREVVQLPDVQEMFKNGDTLSLVKGVAAKVLPRAWSVLKGATGVLAGGSGAVVMVLYTVFLLLDYRRVRENWTDLLPESYRATAMNVAEDFQVAMSRYFRAQALVAACVGVLFAVGFGLIGLPLGILLGLFIGLLNMVPYLQLAGFVPAFFLGAVHALETGNGLWSVFGLIVLVFAVVQIIQDAVLVPRIMGKAMGLSPAMILLSLSVWGTLLGLLGLLIAIPLTCLCWAWYQRLVPPASDASA